MQKWKARPGDEALIADETADPVDREAALFRLIADGVRMPDEIAPWLVHKTPRLRAAAIHGLVGRWHVEGYVGSAEALLVDDPDWLVRRAAASGLSMYIRALPGGHENRRRLIDFLKERLRKDSDPAVQETVYEALLRLADAPADAYFYGKRAFSVEDDVDWELLSRI